MAKYKRGVFTLSEKSENQEKNRIKRVLKERDRIHKCDHVNGATGKICVKLNKDIPSGTVVRCKACSANIETDMKKMSYENAEDARKIMFNVIDIIMLNADISDKLYTDLVAAKQTMSICNEILADMGEQRTKSKKKNKKKHKSSFRRF